MYFTTLLISLLSVMTALYEPTFALKRGDTTARAVAAVGDRCRHSGFIGECRLKGECARSGGLFFRSDRDCPNDPERVKCCVYVGCGSPSGGVAGTCQNVLNRNACKSGAFDDRYPCPGPADVRCCVPDSP